MTSNIISNVKAHDKTMDFLKDLKSVGATLVVIKYRSIKIFPERLMGCIDTLELHGVGDYAPNKIPPKKYHGLLIGAFDVEGNDISLIS